MITKANCQPAPGVSYLAELTAAQIRTLDRDKTVVLMPGGILEETWPLSALFYRRLPQ